VVYDVLRTVDGVSPVLSAAMLSRVGMFVLLYSLLLVPLPVPLEQEIHDGLGARDVETVAMSSLPTPS
jgi:hypothetical protein